MYGDNLVGLGFMPRQRETGERKTRSMKRFRSTTLRGVIDYHGMMYKEGGPSSPSNKGSPKKSRTDTTGSTPGSPSALPRLPCSTGSDSALKDMRRRTKRTESKSERRVVYAVFTSCADKFSRKRTGRLLYFSRRIFFFYVDVVVAIRRSVRNFPLLRRNSFPWFFMITILLVVSMQ